MTSVRDFLGKKDPVDQDHNLDKQGNEQRVSAPLIDMETSVNTFLRNLQGVCPEPKRSCIRSSEVLRESTEVLKEKGKGRIDDQTLDELDRYTVEKVEMGSIKIHKMLEVIVHGIVRGIMQRILAEKAKCEANAAAEQQMLQYELMKLKQIYETVLVERWCIQGERDKLQKDKDKLQLDIDKLQEDKDELQLCKIDETVAAALRNELAKEQDKSICQICFTAPRDAIVLPCTHFQYCHECLQKYQKRSKECPTCRGKINGILQCSLSMS